MILLTTYTLAIKIGLITSVVLQLITTILAFSLIRRTINNIAWWFISAGFLLMAIRRFLEVMQVFESQNLLITGLLGSWIGVIISIILLISLLFIKRIFNIQERIEKVRKDNEARILSAIIKTEEKEREKMAKELHDGLGPLLSAIKMAISAIAKNDNTNSIKELISNTNLLIDESITSLKEISNNLSPHILNDYGIIKALRNFTSRLASNNQPSIFINTNIDQNRFNKNIEVIIYRVISELINNSLKHAQANKINIDIYYENNKLSIDFYDNGKGIDLEKMSKGMGFSNIESRIKSIKGTIQYSSSTNDGFSVHITLNNISKINN